ncbi:MAG: hypothetical protein UX30_C0004G0054 [Candidatus Saccharibacteria bacterium GW2011_GWA2_46_10]|nr:MAG: hypothetical protein UX30_C0004G0054 [Candidatus Saccharibacteria bacterium GW2011_GWA2_46_10]
MNKKLLLFAGALVLSAASRGIAFADGIYDFARGIEINSQMTSGSDGLGDFFTHPRVFNDPPISEQDITDSMANRPDLVCGRRDKGIMCGIDKPIRDLASREAFVNAVHKELNLIAAGYEVALTDHVTGPMYISARLPSLTGIWQSSNDWIMTPVTERRVRSVPWFNTDEEEQKIKDYEQYFSCALSQSAALKWFRRYRWGVKEIRKENPESEDCYTDWTKEWEENDDDTELRKEKERACILEQVLVRDSYDNECKLPDDKPPLLEYLRSIVKFDPPLQKGEIVLLPTLPLKDIDPNLFVWARLGYDDSGKDDEIGLGYKIPYKAPMLSRLCKWNENNLDPAKAHPACKNAENREWGAILGGVYLPPPEEPEPSKKLCSMQFSSKGYLCRPQQAPYCPRVEESSPSTQEHPSSGAASSGAASSGEDEDAAGNNILLTGCSPEHLQGVVRHTISGPDVCEVGGWRTNKIGFEKDGAFVPIKDDGSVNGNDIGGPYKCSNCSADIYCASNGGEEGYPACDEHTALTAPKLTNGVIPVCLPDDSPYNSYSLLHELVHVQQLCNYPPETAEYTSASACCADEVPAYYAFCSAAAEDRNFEGTDITIDICISVLSNASCMQFADRADPESLPCSSKEYSKEEVEEWSKKIFEVLAENKAGNPASCESVIAETYEGLSNDSKKASRSSMALRSLPRVCSDECIAQYSNTIGNNACYIAQCVEESIEGERILPGRLTFNSADESFPWDSDVKPDPQTSDILSSPASPYTKFPAYKPALLAKELDLALCQINGQPIKNPPFECDFKVLRQLALSPANPYAVGVGLKGQSAESEDETYGLQTMAPAIGTRIGASLYKNYFENSVRMFSDIVSNLNKLLTEISSVEYPIESCSRWK